MLVEFLGALELGVVRLVEFNSPYTYGVKVKISKLK
jgi:hypothetical protein